MLTFDTTTPPPTFTAWKATLWPAGGSAAVMLHDRHDTASRDAILKLLQQLASDPANGIDRIVPREELTQLGGFPGAEALVVLRPPFQLGYTFSGALLTPAPSTGMHGYLPSNPLMRSSFFAMGHGIQRAHDIGLIDMRAIAPTVAALLGVTLPSAQVAAIPLR